MSDKADEAAVIRKIEELKRQKKLQEERKKEEEEKNKNNQIQSPLSEAERKKLEKKKELERIKKQIEAKKLATKGSEVESTRAQQPPPSISPTKGEC